MTPGEHLPKAENKASIPKDLHIARRLSHLQCQALNASQESDSSTSAVSGYQATANFSCGGSVDISIVILGTT
jgi:hypothetical protein